MIEHIHLGEHYYGNVYFLNKNGHYTLEIEDVSNPSSLEISESMYKSAKTYLPQLVFDGEPE